MLGILLEIGLLGIRFLDIVDIILVALLLYVLYNFLKGTVAINIFFGIIAIYLIWKLVKVLEMELLSEILGQFISVGVIALIVVFQPEIRKFLLLLGTSTFARKKKNRFLFWKVDVSSEFSQHIDHIVKACQKMSASKTGALIVIGRINELRQTIETGEILDAQISEHLLENIFFKNSPLHDGAVIIINDRVRAARCILPVSKNTNLPTDLGLRHRAAAGITAQSDAIAIIVSEQTGEISCSIEGKITTNIMPVKLKDFIEKEMEG